MSALDVAKSALERGVLRRVQRNGRTIGWRFGKAVQVSRRKGRGHFNGSTTRASGRVFSNATVRTLLNSKYATREGSTVRRRDGVTWRKLKSTGERHD